MSCRTGVEGRVVNLEHARDCNTSGCPGCLPCVPEHGHCLDCGHRHLGTSERWRCARCVGDVRNDLRLIDTYATQAHREVVQRGIGSAAFMVATPAADPEAHGFLHQSASAGRLCKCRSRGRSCPGERFTQGPACGGCKHASCRTAGTPGICPDAAAFLEDARDELHPLTVLGWWDMLWREELGLPAPMVTITLPDGPSFKAEERLTVSRARRFLDDHLTRMAQVFEPDFDQFRTEIAACKTWLENVLGEGVREERGVKCFMCGTKRLVRWYDDELVTLDDGSVVGAQDHWFCPAEGCEHWWSESDYRSKVEGTYVQVADRLTASQIEATYRIPKGSIRGWASLGKVHKRGKSADGLTLYDVADALDMRDKGLGKQRDRVP